MKKAPFLLRSSALLVIFATLMPLFFGCSDSGNNRGDESQTTASPSQNIFSQMSLEDKLWQLFFVTPEAISGYSGEKAVSEDFTGYALRRKVGGIILFADNISSKEQVSAYTEGIENSFSTPVFIGVDEEGGTVSRLGEKA